ncbi:MAG: hypothetical protein WCO93_06420 [bacterium]
MIRSRIKFPISLFIVIFLSAAIVFGRALLPRWLTYDVLSIITWDVFGYYLYLPAIFIHHDLGIRDFTWVQQLLDTYHPTISFYQAYQGPGGDYIMKYPVGLSILFSPFFFIGHIYAGLSGLPQDGLSLPYQVSLAMGCLVYAIVGLWIFRKILNRYFSDTVSALVMVVTVLGTNYFELTAYDGAMPHNFLFTIYAFIVWLTIRWHEKPAWRFAIPLGLLCGLAILVRPTAGIIVMVPLLWNIFGKGSLLEKVNLVRKHLFQVLVMILCLILVLGIQLLYWKIHSGNWIYYSYEKGEELQWISRHLWKVLFSYKKGWLVYTPVMIFAILGFINLWKNIRDLLLPVIVFFVINLLVISSWPTWWYGGSFSQRPLMEAYVLLAFPMGAFIDWLLTRRLVIKIPVFIVITFFILLNLFQTWQYMNFILDPSQMTKKYYWTIFGRTSIAPKDRLYLEPMERNDAEALSDTTGFNRRVIATFDFEQPDPNNPGFYCRDTSVSGNYSLRMSKKLEFSSTVDIQYKDLSTKDFAWIRSTGWVYFTCKPEEVKCSLVISCNKHGDAYKYRMVELEKLNLVPGQWNRVSMDYMTPYLDNKENTVQTYFWFRGDQEILIDDFVVTVFEPKN